MFRYGFLLRYATLSFRLNIKDVNMANMEQALWLHQGFRLEFLGISSFMPGLFLAGLFFFVVNCWILGILVLDVGGIEV